jgi:hypothetical protein
MSTIDAGVNRLDNLMSTLRRTKVHLDHAASISITADQRVGSSIAVELVNTVMAQVEQALRDIKGGCRMEPITPMRLDFPPLDTTQ